MLRELGRRPASPADPLPDAILMEQVVAGDDQAFASLVTRYERALFNYLLRMTQDEALAADLMQETWLRVFQHARRYDPTRKFSTWLLRIAYHCCLDALRQRQRLEQHEALTQHRPPDPARQRDNPQEAYLDKERSDVVRAAVQALSEPHRAVFILRHYHGLSYEEISDIVQCSLGTVKSRLHYAVRQLQRTLVPE